MSRTLVRIVLCWGAIAQLPAQGPDAAPELDYLFFQQQVQPILVAERPGHARCVACHTATPPLLEPLAPDQAAWTNEQSRRNFEHWKSFVVPGEPGESAALLQPLAKAGGGAGFHSGGKVWRTKGDPEWQTLAAWVRGQRLGGLAMESTTGADRILQANAAGDNIHVIDPASREVVGLIDGVEAPRGVAVAPDGERVYAAGAARKTLDVIDVKTLTVIKRIPLSGVPAGVEVAKDGSRVYVATAGVEGSPGVVDVISGVGLTLTDSVALPHPVRNIFLTPDGAHLTASSPESETLSVIDVGRGDLSWNIDLDGGLGAKAFLRNGDGSTKRILTRVNGLRGFAIIDYATRRQINSIELPADGEQAAPASGADEGGIAVSNDGKTVWLADSAAGAVYAYGAPGRCRKGYPEPGERCEWEMLSRIEAGPRPDGLVLTPDGRSVYVALAGADETAVIDVESMQVVERIAVGSVPRRAAAGSLATR